MNGGDFELSRSIRKRVVTCSRKEEEKKEAGKAESSS